MDEEKSKKRIMLLILIAMLLISIAISGFPRELREYIKTIFEKEEDITKWPDEIIQAGILSW